MMLEQALAFEIAQARPERRRDVRVRLRLPMKLREVNNPGKSIEVITETENLSAGGFLCNSTTDLSVGVGL
jgi:c-di-GMP-binding flagellar brake protein YcgR